MAGFLRAHGYDPGPTQRPLLAGGISGALAAMPATAILYLLGSLEVEAQILGMSNLQTIAVGLPLMAVAGAIYARLFGRAANSASNGWLFGMTYGFLLWAGGAVLLLPAVSGGLAPAGLPAVGVFLSLVLWGGVLGLALPVVHRPLRGRLEDAAAASASGPAAATDARASRRMGDQVFRAQEP